MNQDSVNRREFGRRVAIGATVLPISNGLQQTADAGDKDKDDKKKPSSADAKPDATSNDPANLLMQFVQQRYPHKNLDESTLSAIRNEIRQILQQSETLSRFPLENSDEPGFLFAPYRGNDLG